MDDTKQTAQNVSIKSRQQKRKSVPTENTEPVTEVKRIRVSDESKDEQQNRMENKNETPLQKPRTTRRAREVRFMDFASERTEELINLTKIVEGKCGGHKRAFQRVPNYMRRRTMSHNLKRIPRHLQEFCRQEVAKSAKKTKRPSRMHRRRPSQLLQEYNRRQRDFIWLETHIWHAKRFAMISKWGYRLPLYPYEKSERACFRGARETALLQDMSYTCCLELSGPKSILLDGLSKMTDPSCGLTFASKMYISGNYEGSLVIYRCGCYPNKAIAKVSFIWRAKLDDENDGDDTLWIWVHPSAIAELQQELIENFKLTQQIPNSESGDKNCKSNEEKLNLLKQKKEFTKLSPKLKPFYDRMPRYSGNNSVTLTILKDTLVRFRLLGNLSTSILTTVLKAKELQEIDDGDTNITSNWWSKLKPNLKAVHAQQFGLWDDLTNCPFASRLPPNSVLGLTVCDPREGLPVSRKKILPKISETSIENSRPLTLSTSASYSHIWDYNIREEVTFTKMSDLDMNKLRSERLVPGSSLNLKNGSRVPILLIQQSTIKSEANTEGIGNGWDIILPVGWAMAFWIPTVYRCARVGGYRESMMVAREQKQLHFPEDFPDTNAGKTFELKQYEAFKDQYFRYPPNKRPNFIKLGTLAPFNFPWKNLVTDWTNVICQNNHRELEISSIIEKDYFVLRNRMVLQKLKQIQACLQEQKQRRRQKTNLQNGSLNWDDILISDYYMSLVPINTHISQGMCSQFSMICKPNDNDLNETMSGPCETHHSDNKKKARNEFKNAKKKLNRRTSSEASNLDSEVYKKLFENKEDVQEFESFYLPTSKTVMNSCSRQIMGYVKKGGFSLYEGKVTGCGFVSYASLVLLLKEAHEKNQKPKLLIRETHSFQYRFADFDIIS